MADGGAPFSPPLHEDGVHPPLPSRDELSRPQLINNPSATTVFESLPRLLSATTDSLGGFSMSLKPLSLYQGKPSVLFKRSEKATFLHKLKFVLVGKFSHGRPPISSIKSFFAGLKLQGGYNISIFDSKHLFIEVDLRIDYTRLWLKLVWKIDGYAMRIFKWEQQFSPRKESALAPVWIRIEGLPLYMFDEMPLLAVANAIGSPLRVHHLNVNRVKLNSAFICVELDVSKPLVDSIWVSFEDDSSNSVLDGFWVEVFYDVIPHYCSSCLHIGHHFGVCKKRKAEVSAMSTENGEEKAASKVLDQLPQPVQRGNKHGKKLAYAQVWKEKHGTSELNSQRQATSSRGKSLQIDNMVQDVAKTSTCDLHDIAEAESSVYGQRLGKGNFAAKVFDKLSESSSVSDLVPPLGDAFDMTDLHGGQHGGEAVIDEGVITIETSDIQTNKYDFHTPNRTWVEQIRGKFSCEHGAAALGQQEQLQQIGDTKHAIGSVVALDLGHESSKTVTNFGRDMQQGIGEIGKVWPGNQNSAMQAHNNSEQQDVGIETTYTQLMDPNNLSCKENKMLALMLDYNASKMESKVKVLLNYVEDLKHKIDNADSTTVARIAASPSTKAFLKNQVKPHTFSPLPMADLVDQVDNQDPSYSKNVEGVGDNDNGHLVTVLPKLCYEQVSKQQARSTTVQIAHLGEGSGIVKTALLQLKDKGWITDRGLPFDDNG